MKAIRQISALAVLAASILVVGSASPSWSASIGLQNNGLNNPASSAEKVKVEGFRSAKFGMSRDQVKKAIFNDFRVSRNMVKTEIHPTERTKSYLVEVNDLIPDSGKARIAYIFGFKSKKLFQINVHWGNLDNSQGKNAQGLIATANLLRGLFLKKGFAKNKSVANLQLKDGSIIVFRGQDKQGRMILLFLNNPVGNPEQAKKKSAEEKAELAKQMPLILSYMEKPKRPDVFKLKKDDF